MEYNEFEVQEELPQKEFKKHPILSIVLLSISILGVLVSLVFTLLNGMEQLYTCIYAVSLLTLILGFNSILRFKGFCLIFYPMIVLYSIISAYAFYSDLSILEFQFPIIATAVISIYFIQELYESIKKKNWKIIIIPAIILVAAVVLISLFTILPTKMLGSIISTLLIPIIAYELIFIIIDFVKQRKEPTKNEEETKTAEIENENKTEAD